MGPEESMRIQSNLASTIAMAFDECPPSKAERQYVENSVARTTRWLVRCQVEMQRLNAQEDTINKIRCYLELIRGQSMQTFDRPSQSGFRAGLDGYAGRRAGCRTRHMKRMYYILEETVPYLPKNKPTYLMGVGTPANILEGVERGIDFFDCVYPTRNGRHGHLYTNQGKINLFNAKYELDARPIEEGCGCPACRRYSRAYIRHLLKAKEMLGLQIASIHNLAFYLWLVKEARAHIIAGDFTTWKSGMVRQLANRL